LKSLYKTILSKFIWASLVPILLIESSLIAALFWMNHRQTNETKQVLAVISTDSFTEIAQHTSKQLEQQLSQARIQIDQLDLFAETFFTNPQRYTYTQLQLYYDQGFFRDAERGGLSSVYTTNHSVLNASDSKPLELLTLLAPLMKQMVDTNKEVFQGAWINLSKDYSLSYPPINPVEELTPDLDVTQEPFYYEVDAQHNPSKGIKFIPLYQEEWAASLGQLGAYESPLYANGVFIGVLGASVSINNAANLFQHMKLPFNAYAMLVDEENHLLLSSDENRSLRETHVQSFYDIYKKQLSGITSKPLSMVDAKMFATEGKIVFDKPIKGTAFKIIFCVDKNDIYGPVEALSNTAKSIGYYIILALTLFYTLYFITMIRRVRELALKISTPVGQILALSSRLGQDEHLTLPSSDIQELELLVTNLNATHKELLRLINYDETTALFNHHKLRRDVAQCDTSALFFLKINNFNQYNALYGPDVGNGILTLLVNYLLKYTLEGTLYRENENTLAVRVNKVTSHHTEEALQALLNTLSKESFRFNDLDVHFILTAGLTMGTRDDGIDLLAQAHIALAQVPHNAAGTHIKYDDIYEITKVYEENMVWSKNVKEALNEDRIIAFFQPIYNYETQRVEKFESLVRLELEGKIISPFKFLHAATSIGKLHDITLVMLEHVFAMAELYPEIEFSVNTSFDDFEKGKLLEVVKSKLLLNPINPSKIIFEILETDTFNDESSVMEIIKELKKLGFKIAIDDFGTGHSNFAHLTLMEVDYIKIDGMFIKDLETNELSRKMVSTIVTFSKQIGAKTIGEFVHNEAVFDLTQTLGVDYAQGYYKSAPISALEVAKLLRP
jgi:EAL domain-containing protein (putative c-di-GMP-specific phosphodiesterase class I)/GGDEF domain-containing protein